ncbi:MAG: hypothetical protein DHS20C18_10890 [Saprospiraceae bacterium]|nr:MAG: hypothetical protein DHS20C18_10890 [Saprospiraceae bacterium]
MQILKTTYCVLCLLLSNQLQIQAQALHIHYDIQSQQLVYIVNGDTVARPIVKYNNDVFFHVENFNNYLYEVEIERKENTDGSGSGMSGFGSLSGLLPTGGIPGMSGMGGGGLMDFFGIADNELENLESLEGDRGLVESEESQQLFLLKQRTEAVLNDMADIEANISQVNKNLQDNFKKQQFIELAQKEIHHLKYRPGLKPAQIKQLSTEFISKALGSGDLQSLNIDMLGDVDKYEKALKSDLNKLTQAQLNYKTQVRKLEIIQSQALSLNIVEDNEVYQQIESSLLNVFTRGVELQESLEENREKVATELAEGQTTYLRNLIDLRYEIEALKENDFSHTQRFTVEDGGFSLQAKLIPIDSNGVRNGQNALSLSPIRVAVKGGLKISSSVGLSIGQYFDAPQEYLVREGFIVGSDNDSYIPILNTFIHFHPYSAGKARIGGSLGIGIPLISNNVSQSATFLIGPSLIFGNRETIVLSAGILGGKVERLGGGLHVGDAFTAVDGILPIKSLYELGYFFSFSYKIFGK